MWKNKKIRIRGGAPSKIRLSTPYYLLRKDVDRYLAAFDEYKRSEEHTSELQSPDHLVCRLLLEKKKKERSLVKIRCRRMSTPNLLMMYCLYSSHIGVS